MSLDEFSKDLSMFEFSKRVEEIICVDVIR